jgi:hypothetical protein
MPRLEFVVRHVFSGIRRALVFDVRQLAPADTPVKENLKTNGGVGGLAYVDVVLTYGGIPCCHTPKRI